MGRPVPPSADQAHESAATARQGQAQRGLGPPSSAVLSEASLAAEASLRSLSSLLLAARGSDAGLDRRPLSLGALSRPLTRPPLPLPPAPLAPPAAGWRTLLSDANLPSSPPPLAPASEGSDSDYDPYDLEDLPALLSGSPSSQRPSLDDLLCPWGADGLPPRDALHLQPLVRRGSAAAQSAIAYRSQRSAGYFGAGGSAGRRARQPAAAPASPPPLEGELQALAGRLAELVGTHQARLGAAHPTISAGLKDVANQLHRLAAELETGPPPLA